MKIHQSYQSVSDKKLLQLYGEKKDKRCMAELWERYSALVYGLCLRMLKNKEDSLDAVVGIFERILDKSKNHHIEHVNAWIYNLSKNYCLALLRKTQRRRRLFEDFAANLTFESKTTIKESEDYEYLKKALNDLPCEQATCIRLFYFDGFSYSEIVSKTGWALAKVKSHMQNGRRNLRTNLSQKT
jgi:RNA polymerase sigma-70 factor, ECF subfamily